MKSKWIYGIAGIIGLALLVVLLISLFRSNEYVATVAGEKVTKDEFNFFLGSTRASLESASGVKDENTRKEFWNSIPNGKNMQDTAKQQTISTVIEYKIQLIKAKQNKIALDIKEQEKLKLQMKDINTQTDNDLKQSGENTDPEKFFVKRYGVSRAKFQKIYENYVLVSKFAQTEQNKIKPTDEEISKFYEDNKDNLDKVTVKHILLSTLDVATSQPMPQDKQDAAKEMADKLLSKVKTGEDFTALVKQYSQDPGSKDTGGEYTFVKGEMLKEFEAWSFKAKPGDVGIVKTGYGYHVVKFEKRTTLSDVKEDARKALINERYSEILENWSKEPGFIVITNPKVYDSIKVGG